jgi:hypothetical protein
MLVYIAVPYRDIGDQYPAETVAELVANEGNIPVMPFIDIGRANKLSPDTIYGKSIAHQGILARCDAILLHPKWREDEGTCQLEKYARETGIWIYSYPEIPAKHPTEIQAPVQSEKFMEIIMNMYRVQLKKNADYSPANILGTGEIGLVTRLWDKMARLMNLSGFEIKIDEARYVAPRHASNESIDDTLLDMSVYAIIGKLLRENSWGK